MKKIFLTLAICMTFASNAQANVIVDEYAKMKMDFEQNVQEGKDQFARNKEQLQGLFFKIKSIVKTTTDKLDELNNVQ